MIILSVFCLNANELANAVHSPDMTCRESVYTLRATESPVRPEWLRWQMRLDDSAFSERQAGCGQRHSTGHRADNIVIVGTILTFNSGGWDTGRNSTWRCEMNYLVLEERPQGSAVVHRVGCSKARDQERRAPRGGLCHGPFPTEVAALAAAKRTRPRVVRSCHCCLAR